MKFRLLILSTLFILSAQSIQAQELEATITINTSKIQGTDKSIFENLKETLEKFINERQWTELQFQKNERIQCSFNITVNKYDKSENTFSCTALIQANRPVWNTSYTTTIYNNKDANFDFEFAQFDQLNFSDENIENQLTTLLAYYAYLIIGIDLDTFSPFGGEDILVKCMNLVNNAQTLSFTGWKSFDDDRNRFAFINDYLDEQLKPFRQLQYDYYRKGLDEMVTNVERGRTNVTTAIEELLKVSHENRPLSKLPQIWVDYKKDELVSIYKGKGTQKEKESVYNILFDINPSQNNTLSNLKN